MGIALLIMAGSLYILYRLGNWLVVFSKSLEKNEVSSNEYHQKVLDSLNKIANNTSTQDTAETRLNSMITANAELMQRKNVRKMIEEELDIEI
jgi:hypothetical protein